MSAKNILIYFLPLGLASCGVTANKDLKFTNIGGTENPTTGNTSTATGTNGGTSGTNNGGATNPCGSDGNDTIACATSISINGAINGQIASETDLDFYKVTISDTIGTYRFQVYDAATNICSLDSTLVLYDSDQTTVLSSNNNASAIGGPVPDPCSAINGVFSQNGTYYLRVAGNATGSPKTGNYTLGIVFTSMSITYPSGVQAHLKADETSGAMIDAKGYQNLTQYGTVGTTTGTFGTARGGNFSGSNYFRGGDPSKFNSVYFMVEFWMKTTSTGIQQYIIDNSYWYFNGSYSNFWGWEILQTTSNTIQIGTGDGGSVLLTAGTKNIADGNWHYVVVARINTTDPVKLRLYIDNVRQTSAETTYSYLSFNGSGFWVGRDFYYYTPEPYFGYIDDIVYWNTPPTTWNDVEAAISNRWNGGSPKQYR